MLARRTVKALVLVSLALVLFIFKFPQALLSSKRVLAYRRKNSAARLGVEAIGVTEHAETQAVFNASSTATKSTNEHGDLVSHTNVGMPGNFTVVVKNREIYPQTSENFTIYGEENCTRNQAAPILAKLFIEWIRLADKAQIEYFLTCGSLLGAYRNGNLIPEDSDMDILINGSDFTKIKKYRTKKKFSGFESSIFIYVNKDFHFPYAKRRRFTCRGKLVPKYSDHCSFVEPLGRLISENHHLDIYDYTRKGDHLWDPSEGGRLFHVNEVFPLRDCYFMSLKTKCPNRPKEFLNKFYGEDLSPNKVCRNGRWVKKNSI